MHVKTQVVLAMAVLLTRVNRHGQTELYFVLKCLTPVIFQSDYNTSTKAWSSLLCKEILGLRKRRLLEDIQKVKDQ